MQALLKPLRYSLLPCITVELLGGGGGSKNDEYIAYLLIKHW
jgi:hypothetical protein